MLCCGHDDQNPGLPRYLQHSLIITASFQGPWPSLAFVDHFHHRFGFEDRRLEIRNHHGEIYCYLPSTCIFECVRSSCCKSGSSNWDDELAATNFTSFSAKVLMDVTSYL